MYSLPRWPLGCYSQEMFISTNLKSRRGIIYPHIGQRLNFVQNSAQRFPDLWLDHVMTILKTPQWLPPAQGLKPHLRTINTEQQPTSYLPGLFYRSQEFPTFIKSHHCTFIYSVPLAWKASPTFIYRFLNSQDHHLFLKSQLKLNTPLPGSYIIVYSNYVCVFLSVDFVVLNSSQFHHPHLLQAQKLAKYLAHSRCLISVWQT